MYGIRVLKCAVSESQWCTFTESYVVSAPDPEEKMGVPPPVHPRLRYKQRVVAFGTTFLCGLGVTLASDPPLVFPSYVCFLVLVRFVSFDMNPHF